MSSTMLRGPIMRRLRGLLLFKPLMIKLLWLVITAGQHCRLTVPYHRKILAGIISYCCIILLPLTKANTSPTGTTKKISPASPNLNAFSTPTSPHKPTASNFLEKDTKINSSKSTPSTKSKTASPHHSTNGNNWALTHAGQAQESRVVLWKKEVTDFKH